MTTIEQDFHTVADNTALNGLVLTTGQTVALEGNTSAVVNCGKVVPGGNTYIVLPFPQRSGVLTMRHSWPLGAIAGNGKVVCIAIGRKVNGEITRKMVHVACDVRGVDSPSMTIWDSAIPGWEYGYALPFVGPVVDPNIPSAPVGDITDLTVIVAGNRVIAMCDCLSGSPRVSKTALHETVSSHVGDGVLGDGTGYVFFQSGWTAQPGLPYIHSISARSLTPVEMGAFL